ncbi:anoctamin-4 [Aplysia californica]|uniref:Anoctamin n=1 Tax=Aplysia californica TaxID=6500 RepID=A0ABM1VWU3_APLCA|nr:anoctamin-4 [Aplysia californica]
MDEKYDGVPLSPDGVAPIGFEMTSVQEGVSPSNEGQGLYPEMNSEPLPPAPIGFEAHDTPQSSYLADDISQQELISTSDCGSEEVKRKFIGAPHISGTPQSSYLADDISEQEPISTSDYGSVEVKRKFIGAPHISGTPQSSYLADDISQQELLSSSDCGSEEVKRKFIGAPHISADDISQQEPISTSDYGSEEVKRKFVGAPHISGTPQSSYLADDISQQELLSTSDCGSVEVKRKFIGAPHTSEAEPPRSPGDDVKLNLPDEAPQKSKKETEVRDNIVLLDNGQGRRGMTEEEASLFMDDGVRRVDFVLVYTEDNNAGEEGKKSTRRANFQQSLEKEGLQLEVSTREYDKDEKTYYVKVHAPWEVLTRFAEIMNMKMPLVKNDMSEKFETCWSKCPTPFDYDEDILPEIPDYFTAPFSRAREQQGKFIIEDKATFFSPAQRSLLTHQILARAIFEDLGDPSKNKFGIKKMISSGAYSAAFPLHEGEYTSEHSLLSRGPENQRHLLYETWAKPGVFYKFQPLDHIRLYFGEKIAIYFTWLGYYTGLLIPAGLVGLAIFIYGVASMPYNETSNEICDSDGPGNFTMCPLCDGRCTYWRLKRSCGYARVTYMFDNELTVGFAAFMALWAVVFHEMWKRREAEIKYDWDVEDFEEEETIRPEFEASVRRRKLNPINKLFRQGLKILRKADLYEVDEPYISFYSRCLRFTSSLWVVLFMLCVVVAAVFGVIVYRMTVSALLYAVNQETIKERASTITAATAACINLVIIIILGRVYQVLAELLTNFETHRTLTEWEDSFTLKMFLFQFVNHYASLFYIAFLKGKFVGRPGDYNREINGERQEECDPAGCLIELCIQLGIIMVGKQAFNNFKELILPKLMNWFKSRKMKEAEEKNQEKVTRWEKDYTMATMPDLGLFDEYLEMVIQYGFVTIFVAAFPLAPICALLNNIIEIRLDAYKFTTQWRRPLAMRAQDIGIWFGILQGISRIAVVTNALIIAFTSEFIPKLVYRYSESSNDSLEGYINFSLSVFNVSDFSDKAVPTDKKIAEFGIVEECRYRDFRSNEAPYSYTLTHWQILTAKLAFILVFVVSVTLLSWLISYLVPDVPRAVKLQVLREKHLAREAVLEAEHLRPGGGIAQTGQGLRERKAAPSGSNGTNLPDPNQPLY